MDPAGEVDAHALLDSGLISHTIRKSGIYLTQDVPLFEPLTTPLRLVVAKADPVARATVEAAGGVVVEVRGNRRWGGREGWGQERREGTHTMAGRV